MKGKLQFAGWLTVLGMSAALAVPSFAQGPRANWGQNRKDKKRPKRQGQPRRQQPPRQQPPSQPRQEQRQENRQPRQEARRPQNERQNTGAVADFLAFVLVSAGSAAVVVAAET